MYIESSMIVLGLHPSLMILGKEIEPEDVDNLLNTQDWHRFPDYEGQQLSSPR